MGRVPVTVSLEEDLWIKFKQYCVGKKVDASDLFEKHMQKVVNKNTPSEVVDSIYDGKKRG